MLTSASDCAVFVLCCFSFTSLPAEKHVFSRLPLKRTEKSHLAESITCVTLLWAHECGWALSSLPACLWLLLEVPAALQTPHCIWNTFIFKRLLPSLNLSQQQQGFGSLFFWIHLECQWPERLQHGPRSRSCLSSLRAPKRILAPAASENPAQMYLIARLKTWKIHAQSHFRDSPAQHTL